jgi:hypothetical protein
LKSTDFSDERAVVFQSVQAVNFCTYNQNFKSYFNNLSQ